MRPLFLDPAVKPQDDVCMVPAPIQQLFDQYVLPTYGRFPMALARGDGTYVWDTQGKKYLDFVSGIAVDNLGHTSKLIQRALKKDKGIIHCSNLYYIPEQGELARRLVTLTGTSKAFFCNSGAEANEAAIKFARAWSVQTIHPARYHIIVAKNSFHGRTLGAISATAQKKYQKGFGPLVPGFKVVPYNDVNALEAKMTDRTCAIILEAIQGEGGVHIPSPDYLRNVRALCDQKNVLLIMDEVQTGMSRTGHFLASQHFKVQPDIVTLSKALAGGYPMGTCLVNEKVASVVKPGLHASTFGGNPMACRVALENLKILAQKSFLDRVRTNGTFFLESLEELGSSTPLIKDVRGLGLMLACELKRKVGKELWKECAGRGLLINVIQDKIVRFIPPLTVTRREIGMAMGILKESIGAL